ncbi:MAG: phosphatidylglycerol:prolipoprotein diacylglycerol transferase [Paracoccaceae bacterium]|jgi:phosphatidylglycerol:prolipoprotein diacylglycerol transferase
MSYITFPDISPDLLSFDIGNLHFALRWYALAYITGILAAWRIMVILVRQPALWGGRATPSAPQIENLISWLILGVIVGGRLGYVLFYQPGYYLSNPREIYKVWQGGMAFHGGFLGVLALGLLYSRQQKIPSLVTADLLAFGAPLGLMLGRTANFINAELWGRATNLPWGVAFPGEAAQACATLTQACVRHPTQLYEALLEGLTLGLFLAYLALRRGWLAQPGAIFGMFLTFYGSARFLVEFVRQPDAQFITFENTLGLAFHIQGYGLTMGQTLSLPMVAFGIWLMQWAHKNHVST